MLMIAGALIVSAIVMMSCAGKIADIWQPGSANDADKIASHVNSINQLTRANTPATQQQYLSLSENELILYYSAGQDPIRLLYTGSNTQDNGHLIFERPQNNECDNKACVCYCYQGPFWRSIEDKPYLEARRLFTREDEDAYGWLCTHMVCEATEDEFIVFTNSRGQDTQYVQDAVDFSKQNDYQAIPLQIPLLLQGEYKGEDIYFANQKKEHVEYLQQSYNWDGGVVLGGYAYSSTKRLRKRQEFDAPIVQLTVETDTKEHVVGVCLQKKCLYTNAVANAKANTANIQAQQQAITKFTNLVEYTNKDFANCMVNAGVQSEKELCAYSLQNQFALATSADLTTNPYTVRLEESNNGKTTLQLIRVSQGNTNVEQEEDIGLFYPYVQQGTGTPTKLNSPEQLTKDNQGKLILGSLQGVATELSITANTQGTSDVILFTTS